LAAPKGNFLLAEEKQDIPQLISIKSILIAAKTFYNL
jgi:hypothetical protein